MRKIIRIQNCIIVLLFYCIIYKSCEILAYFKQHSNVLLYYCITVLFIKSVKYENNYNNAVIISIVYCDGDHGTETWPHSIMPSTLYYAQYNVCFTQGYNRPTECRDNNSFSLPKLTAADVMIM